MVYDIINNKNIQIQDNFIDTQDFENIKCTLTNNGTGFPWYYFDYVDFENNGEESFQFVHHFYRDNKPTSQAIELLNPIINKLNLFSLHRIKANLTPRTSFVKENEFHNDVQLSDNYNCTTGIFYVNSNNGYTLFKDGSKIYSDENRFVSFPANMAHTGTSCSNSKIRVVINFNYIEL